MPALEGKGYKLDILLNCAGIQRRHPSEKFPTEDWDEVSSWRLLVHYLYSFPMNLRRNDSVGWLRFHRLEPSISGKY